LFALTLRACGGGKFRRPVEQNFFSKTSRFYPGHPIKFMGDLTLPSLKSARRSAVMKSAFIQQKIAKSPIFTRFSRTVVGSNPAG
jgi:hypothetical protein